MQEPGRTPIAGSVPEDDPKTLGTPSDTSSGHVSSYQLGLPAAAELVATHKDCNRHLPGSTFPTRPYCHNRHTADRSMTPGMGWHLVSPMARHVQG